MKSAARKPRMSKISTKADRFLNVAYKNFVADHRNRSRAALDRIFILTTLNVYALENWLIDENDADRNLASLPKNLVNDLRTRLVTNEVKFDWTIPVSMMSALIESIISPRAQQAEGVRCISVENIHRVLEPLFLDDLRAELDQCAGDRAKLIALHEKIAGLKFFDPVVRAGSFLIEALIGLRRLEREIVASTGAPLKVSIEQFYGIDINERAIEIATVALRIADLQTRSERVTCSVSGLFDFVARPTASAVVNGAVVNGSGAAFFDGDTNEQKDAAPIDNGAKILGNVFEQAGAASSDADDQPSDSLSAQALNRPTKIAVVNGSDEAFFGGGTNDRVRSRLDRPLENLKCGNALELDWEKIVDDADYIIGNPPTLSMTFQDKRRKDEIAELFRDERGRKFPKVGKIDYGACWLLKAARYMRGRSTRAGFATVDSICQSEQAQLVWQPLFEHFDVRIEFARRPFKWIDVCSRMQRLIGVIVGLGSARSDRPRIIYDGDKKIAAENINGYLLDAPNIFIGGRLTPLCDVPEMRQGNQATDGGNLIIERDDYDDFIRREPRAKKFIRRFMMGREFVNDLPRWCLWLTDATEEDLNLPLIKRRIDAVRLFRLASTFNKTQRLAQRPHLFREQFTPQNCIALPKLLSDKRRYLTADWLDETVIAGDQLFLIEGADLYHFGVLSSSVHMAWVKAFGGKFGTGYCYSKTIVYNNFVWCARSARIEETAQKILDVRSKYPTRSLASLYDDRKMPDDLRAAHEENDRAVARAYGFEGLTEVEIVSRLMAECINLLDENRLNNFEE